MEIKPKQNLSEILHPDVLKSDIEFLLGEVEVVNKFGNPVNPVEVMGVYAYVLADTYDRRLAFTEASDYIYESNIYKTN